MKYIRYVDERIKFDGMIEYYCLENVTEAFESLVSRKTDLQKQFLNFSLN